MNNITVNNVTYNVIKLLGKGKGGYSYLAERDGRQYVVATKLKRNKTTIDG